MTTTSAFPTVLESTLRDVIATGVIEGLTAVGRSGHFVIVVRIGSIDMQVAGTRGKPRAFASVASVVTFLTRMGVRKFQVDATEFKPGRVRGPRPDRTEAMRRATTQATKKSKDR